jgi:PAS domain S-box-containing protein
MVKRPTNKELQARIDELERMLDDNRLFASAQTLNDNAAYDLRTKQELIDQLRFIKILFDTVPNPIFYKNREGIYLGCNQSFSMQILGLPPEAIIGRSLFDLPQVIPRDLAEIYYQQDLNLINNPGKQVYEAKVHCADGIVRDFLFYKATYTDHKGEIAGIIGLMLDVTERNSMQVALKESEEKYRSMMESMNDAVYICSPDFHISYMNPKMVGIIGYDATGQKCHKVLHNLDAPCPWCTFDSVKRGEITEVEVTSPKNRHTYIITNSPIFHQNGSISKMTIYRDKTNRKLIEEELLKARKLETAGVFAGGIAHDYNNLLFIILGNLLMLEKNPGTPANASGLLQAAEAAAQKAAKLTKRLLTFTRGESLTMDRYAVAELLEEIVSGISPDEKHPVELRIPPGVQHVYVDPGLISMAVTNIITNAREAMEEGGEIIISAENVRFDKNPYQVIGVPADTGSEYVRIAIADKGMGIDQEVLPKIFDPYFSTKKRCEEKGLGLGLSASYSIIRKHNGTIRVESAKGMGTTVSIYLPANPPNPQPTLLG